MDLQNNYNASFSSYSYRFAYSECRFRTVRNKSCPWSVATLLSTRTLAILIACKSEKRAAKLHLAVSAAAINFMDLIFWYPF